MQILTDSGNFVGAGNLDWQQHMKTAIRDPAVLVQLLNLPPDTICWSHASGPFRLFVPRPYLSRIAVGDADDPLLRQVMPVPQESETPAGYSGDPLQEASFAASPGLLQKYQERALLVVNGTCAVHCRYCFRRHFPYSEASQNDERFEASVGELEADPSLREVILSGGDPLTVVDDRLEKVISRLENLAHIRRLRIHTRLPVVIPQRVTPRLCSILQNCRFDVVLVIHANHGNEIDSEVAAACSQLRNSCNAVLNQSVLLKGINDDVDTLKTLGEKLVSCGVIPYYLHQLDPVAGAAHFQVPVERGKQLIKGLREKAAGYLVPRFVQEIPGQPNKTIMA